MNQILMAAARGARVQWYCAYSETWEDWEDNLPLLCNINDEDRIHPDTEALRKELDDALKDRVALAMELERVKGERDAALRAALEALKNHGSSYLGHMNDYNAAIAQIEALGVK